jgi:hypothetical protein
MLLPEPANQFCAIVVAKRQIDDKNLRVMRISCGLRFRCGARLSHYRKIGLAGEELFEAFAYKGVIIDY